MKVAPSLRVGVLLALGAASAAFGQLSPGPLSSPHARLEGSGNCLSCHRAGKGVDPALCFSCHGALADRVASDRGLHADPAFARCERCHSEHNGEQFELVHFPEGQDRFDHQRTGWRLEGAHARVACRQCHTAERVAPAVRRREPQLDPSRTFLGLATTCASCHADPHEGTMKAGSCADCHSQTSWREPRGIDHDATRFPLTGAHARTACADCHRPPTGQERTLVFGQFSGRPLPTCASCHADPHRGRLGADCASCHGTDSFDGRLRGGGPPGFDHDRTGWPLAGRHRAVACQSCHSGGLRIAAADRCETCHRDPHLGQLRRTGTGPTSCVSCHSVEGFLPARFDASDHAASDFPLVGAHLAVPCPACHGSVPASQLPVAFRRASNAPVRAFRIEASTCTACHLDPHRGAFDTRAGAAGCRHCHDADAWSPARFDHAATRFPLEGAHQRVACGACHPDDASGRAQLTGRPLTCDGCHGDPHAGQFATGGATACATCHSTNAFRPLTGFDHARDSRFPLDGRHATVACASCHPTETVGGTSFVRWKPRPLDCAGCHAAAPSSTTAPTSVRR